MKGVRNVPALLPQSAGLQPGRHSIFLPHHIAPDFNPGGERKKKKLPGFSPNSSSEKNKTGPQYS
jgi:hypothetical protein